MYQNMSTLSELKHKQQDLQTQLLDLQSEMDTFNVTSTLLLLDLEKKLTFLIVKCSTPWGEKLPSA